MNTNPPKLMIDEVKHFFEQDDWPFKEIEGKSALCFLFEGEKYQWSCLAKANEEDRILIFYSISPISSQKEKHPLIAEFITRVNYGLLIGNFEFDFSDGEIRYKTSLDIDDSELNQSLIKPMVYTNVLTMAQYLPGIFAILREGITVEEAYRTTEENA